MVTISISNIKNLSAQNFPAFKRELASQQKHRSLTITEATLYLVVCWQILFLDLSQSSQSDMVHKSTFPESSSSPWIPYA